MQAETGQSLDQFSLNRLLNQFNRITVTVKVIFSDNHDMLPCCVLAGIGIGERYGFTTHISYHHLQVTYFISVKSSDQHAASNKLSTMGLGPTNNPKTL